MIQKELQIQNKLGLHARAATLLVKLAQQFDANIEIFCNGIKADAKSIMDILMLAGTVGSFITLMVDSDDPEEEESAVTQITELIQNRFNEKE